MVATCHLVLGQQSTSQYQKLFDNIVEYLRHRYGISYVTIQPEFTTQSRHSSAQELNAINDNECLMKCPRVESRNSTVFDDCGKMSCCVSEDLLEEDHEHHHTHHHHHAHHHHV